MPLDCRSTIGPASASVRFVMRCDGFAGGLVDRCPAGAEAELAKGVVGFDDDHEPAWREGLWLFFVERLPDCRGLDVKRYLCPACAAARACSTA